MHFSEIQPTDLRFVSTIYSLGLQVEVEIPVNQTLQVCACSNTHAPLQCLKQSEWSQICSNMSALPYPFLPSTTGKNR